MGDHLGDEQVGAIVLCGGKSRRMGTSKAFLRFGDETLLQRMVRQVQKAADPVVVVAAQGQELPDLPSDVRIARDTMADRGPLQGLAAGLSAMPASVEFVYASSTDAPFLAEGWIPLLTRRIGDADLAIVNAGGYDHPLAALYRRSSCLPAIEMLLRENRLRPTFLVELVHTVVLSPSDFETVDPELRTLRNLNTPEDYLRALDES